MKQHTVDWQKYRSNLYHFILRRTKSATVAEDIVQDVFVKVYENQKSIRNAKKLRQWIFQIARNTIIDYYRTREQTDQLPSELINDEEAVKDNVESELVACLNPFVKKLPKHYRQAIMLSELEGLTQREIASVLELSYSGAKSRIQRGREMLEGMLLECCKIELDSRGKIMDYKPNQSCNSC